MIAWNTKYQPQAAVEERSDLDVWMERSPENAACVARPQDLVDVQAFERQEQQAVAQAGGPCCGEK